MRIASSSLIVLALSSASLAEAPVSPSDELARSIAELSGEACYGLMSGAIAIPGPAAADHLDKSIKAIEGMGLSFGVNDGMMNALGAPGLRMVSQSTMGSKAFALGDVVLAAGGREPGCRVILLAEPSVSVTELVSTNMTRLNWKLIPSMTATHGAIERRSFFRRDNAGNPYLMNLWTIATPIEGSKIRLFTTTVRIPDGVQLPSGL